MFYEVINPSDEATGSARDAPFSATPENPKTVVVQMPMKVPGEKG